MNATKDTQRILFIHNKAINYRLPLFKKLSICKNIIFCFTRENSNIDIDKLNFKGTSLNLGINVSFLKHFQKYIKILFTYDFDIIISGDPYLFETQIAFIVSRFRKKTFVLFSEEWIIGSSLKRRLASPILNYIVKHSDACVVPGFRHKNHLIEMGASSEKIFIAPNASYTGNFEINKEMIEKTRNSLGVGKKNIILYMGRIVEYKGLEYLLRAFKKIEEKFEDSLLLIAGTGNNELKMKRLSEELGIKNVCFYGWVDEETKKEFFEMADLVVLPSIYHKAAEAWGLVLNEAMYHSKPVITTNMVGAAYSLVKHGINGYIVKEKDINELCNAIEKIIYNPELKKQMGSKSKEIIKFEYNYENQANGFIKAIDYSTE